MRVNRKAIKIDLIEIIMDLLNQHCGVVEGRNKGAVKIYLTDDQIAVDYLIFLGYAKRLYKKKKLYRLCWKKVIEDRQNIVDI